MDEDLRTCVEMISVLLAFSTVEGHKLTPEALEVYVKFMELYARAWNV